MVKKPKLSKTHKISRLQWAIELECRTLEGWKRVILSDEIKINTLNSDDIKYVWSKAPKGYPAAVVNETLKFRGASVMICGARFGQVPIR